MIARRRTSLLHLITKPRPAKAALPAVLKTVRAINADLDVIAMGAPEELETVRAAVAFVRRRMKDEH
jgi:hypothetical protein